jgi:membrane protein implicated in regulation of membrane protease activity
MSKTALTYLEAVALIAAVSLPVHYLGGVDWPWAIVIGAAASIALRWLIHRAVAIRLRRPPLAGGR